jgi:hypothetical protein
VWLDAMADAVAVAGTGLLFARLSVLEKRRVEVYGDRVRNPND